MPERRGGQAGDQRAEQRGLHEVVLEDVHAGPPRRTRCPVGSAGRAGGRVVAGVGVVPGRARGTAPSWTTGRRARPPRGSPAAPAARARGRRAAPCRRRRRTARRASANASWLAASTPAVGSSSTSSSGSAASARAISARCCWPPESAATGSWARSASPTAASAAATAARSAAHDRPVACRQSGRQRGPAGRRPPPRPPWPARRCRRRGVGARSRSAATVPQAPQRRRRTAGPGRRMSGTSPRSAADQVDLPEPLAPRTATTSPARDASATPSRRTGRPP